MPTIEIDADGQRSGRCTGKNCGAVITWVKTIAGRNMPITGRVVALRSYLDERSGKTIEVVDAADAHWTSCPNAADFKPSTQRVPDKVEQHRCAAKGCERKVPVTFLMCTPHWRMVPADIQARVWKYYRRGQEFDGRPPSGEYWEATLDAVRAVAEKERGPLFA